RLAELGVRDAIPEVVEDAVAACLAKDPAKRPQSASEVLKLLERSELPALSKTTDGPLPELSVATEGSKSLAPAAASFEPQEIEQRSEALAKISAPFEQPETKRKTPA